MERQKFHDSIPWIIMEGFWGLSHGCPLNFSEFRIFAAQGNPGF
jgi:hypothetical protein